MSSMKQVVYAGAFGALVAMQGCGTDEPAKEVVTPTGEQSLQAAVEEVVEQAQETIAKFDHKEVLNQATKLANDNGLDVDVIKGTVVEALKDVQEVKPETLKQYMHDAVKTWEDTMPEMKEAAAKFKQQVSDVIADLTPAMTVGEAQKVINDYCDPKNGQKNFDKNPKQATADLFKAAGVMINNGDKVKANCKPGFQWSKPPCFQVKYVKLTVEAIKAKQGISEDLKGKKPTKTKEIYDVIPTNIPSDVDVKELSAINDHITEASTWSTKTNYPAMMTYMKALNDKFNPKTAAKPAIKNGKKVEEKKAEKVEEKVEEGKEA